MKKVLIILSFVCICLSIVIYIYISVKSVDKVSENEVVREEVIDIKNDEISNQISSEKTDEIGSDLDDIKETNINIENNDNSSIKKQIQTSNSSNEKTEINKQEKVETHKQQVNQQAVQKPTEVVKEPVINSEIKIEEVIPKEALKNIEEFKVNTQMAQTMVNIINSNPSHFMIDNGYSVIIDSSIVTQTNQFTFTQQRVIDKTIWKCGVIKVYARDYYLNGNYVWTECYLI